MQKTRTIWCTGCNEDVQARLTDGGERYPHRPDLKDIPFWKCDTCGNYVGCHWRTATPTLPLGCIATPEILDARKKLHALIDPIWKGGRLKRGQVYAHMTNKLGYNYHNGEIRSMDEARTIWKIAVELHNSLLTTEELVASEFKQPKYYQKED